MFILISSCPLLALTISPVNKDDKEIVLIFTMITAIVVSSSPKYRKLSKFSKMPIGWGGFQ